MSLSSKIFFSVFLTTLILGGVLLLAAHSHVSNQSKERFVIRYSVFTKILSDALTRLDINTEALMYNAAKVVAAKDAEHGLLSTQTLKDMRSELSVTHIFVIDKLGNFIRSTNEDPELIPNAYSFCSDYRNMATGVSPVEATPIIHPQPEPKPYKFLFVPTNDLERIIEVGVRIDFIAKTLTEALGSDPNVISLSLYSPDGTSFGRFDSKHFDFSEEQVKLPSQFPNAFENEEHFKFYTKVTSSHPKCCQCDVSGVSRNGEYYYVLESNVSKNELVKEQTQTRNIFMVLMLLNLALALFFGRLISRRLVKNIETAVDKVRCIKKSKDMSNRIGLQGKDEVSFLTGEFDNLLDTLEKSQKRIVEAERLQTKIQFAREVAHNIKSPAKTIERVAPLLTGVPDKLRKVLYDAVHEISVLVMRLSLRGEPVHAEKDASHEDVECVSLSRCVGALIKEKQVEYNKSVSIKIEHQDLAQGDADFVLVDPVELKAMISNLTNNAIESYSTEGGTVKVITRSDEELCTLKIIDEGEGMPKEVLDRLGKSAVTYGKRDGQGVGFLHAFRVVGEWRGHISVNSVPNAGTQVTIVLPRVKQPTEEG